MNPKDKVLRIAEACEDRKAQDVVILDLNGLTLIADYFVICHGNSDVHMDAITDGIREILKEIGDKEDYRVEGNRSQGWILIDCGDVIAHVFSSDDREYYALERLWGDAKELSADIAASK